MKKEISIIWFRQDLRLADNQALMAAAQAGKILPIYVFDDCAPKKFKIGSVSKIWLHHSISKLNKNLDSKLNVYVGKSSNIISYLIEQYKIRNIFWNTCYEPWHLKQEEAVKAICNKKSINYRAFNSNYLWSPNDILKNDGSYYKVFTAYKKKSYLLQPRTTIKIPNNLTLVKDYKNKVRLSDLDLIPQQKKWHRTIENMWDIGEIAAQNKLKHFLKSRLCGYKDGRNYPANNQTSQLSPHLHVGEISPAQILESISSFGYLRASDDDVEHFLNEIIWREFSCYLLYHFDVLNSDNFNAKFDNFNWSSNAVHLRAWQTGNTGYPIVDAGMRELWQTGYMHNRVRMVAASFLVKNLNIHWHKGRDWFWDCLVDADLANNSASWQWVAGCGADAAPYFRIFNPILQGERFDKNGGYTRKFIPELRSIPDKYLFKPWMAPEEVLKSSGVSLGETYPNPIVDLATSRNRALEVYRSL